MELDHHERLTAAHNSHRIGTSSPQELIMSSLQFALIVGDGNLGADGLGSSDHVAQSIDRLGPATCL